MGAITKVSSSGTINVDADGFLALKGERGAGIYSVTTAPSSYTTTIGDFEPTYRIALSTVKSQAKTSEIIAGDELRYSYYLYPVGYVDDSYVYLGARVSLRGSTGAKGAPFTYEDFTEEQLAALKGSDASVTASNIEAALGYTPAKAYTYGTEDLTAGTSELETGKLHFIYE